MFSYFIFSLWWVFLLGFLLVVDLFACLTTFLKRLHLQYLLIPTTWWHPSLSISKGRCFSSFSDMFLFSPPQHAISWIIGSYATQRADHKEVRDCHKIQENSTEVHILKVWHINRIPNMFGCHIKCKYNQTLMTCKSHKSILYSQ